MYGLNISFILLSNSANEEPSTVVSLKGSPGVGSPTVGYLRTSLGWEWGDIN